MNQYQLIAIDMDGTLLDTNSQLSPANRSALLRALEAGAEVVICSGRPLCALGEMIDLLPGDRPIATCNGARAVLSRSGAVLFEKGLTPETLRETLELAYEHDLPACAWVGDEIYATFDCPQVRNYQSISNAPLYFIDDIEDFCRDKVALKVVWIGEPVHLAAIMVGLQSHFDGRANVATSRPYLLEFVDAEVSKAAAMEAICGHLKLDPARTIAVGDGHNDLPMLLYAGLGVAMANAPEAVRGQVSCQAPSNDEDGVAWVIDNFLLNN